MIGLGISLYPEQETLEEMEAYIKLASKYGFNQIFTSMFSVPGEVDEVKALFTKLCTLAHVHNMEVCIDANAPMFEKYGATAYDISVFKEIGVDEIRMDFCFGDQRDVALVENKEKIKIQFSAFMVNTLIPVVEKLADSSVATMCYNFYPQRYTGVSLADFIESNKIWKSYNTKLAAFISSNQNDAHGPWPVYDGLPTLEKHRFKPIGLQVRELLALGIDTIYFGNAFASDEEFKAAKLAVDGMMIDPNEPETAFEKMARAIMPNMGKKRIVMAVDKEDGLNEIEQAILLDFKKHCDLGDSNEWMLRSRITRTIYRGKSIPLRICAKEYFEPGDVLIVNDNLKQYLGEIQICRSPMENDGQRNLVGHLNSDEFELVKMIKPGDYFSFQ